MVIDRDGHWRSGGPGVGGDVVDAVQHAAAAGAQAAHHIDLAVAAVLGVEQVVRTGGHTGQGGPGISAGIVAISFSVRRAADGVATEGVDAGAVASHSRSIHGVE